MVQAELAELVRQNWYHPPEPEPRTDTALFVPVLPDQLRRLRPELGVLDADHRVTAVVQDQDRRSDGRDVCSNVGIGGDLQVTARRVGPRRVAADVEEPAGERSVTGQRWGEQIDRRDRGGINAGVHRGEPTFDELSVHPARVVL